MSRIAYVNGRYVPHGEASIHVEDRGYQFADGVYEVCEVRGGALIDARRHLDRLDRSLGALRIAPPMSRAALLLVLRETVRRNTVRNGMVYMQVTRGVARRDHAFPPADTPASIVVTARRSDFAAQEALAATGVKVISLPENRWPRVDIKTVGLLPNVLAKQAAKEAGAREAWFVDAAGHVTEGASTNAWIVTAGGTIVTRPADAGILRGITRTVVLEEARALGYALEERPFTLAEAHAAAEAFITAASTLVMPVIAIDGQAVGDGKPGPVATRLRQRFHDFAEFSI
ncbi:D-amino-acid transaminase [Xanthobacter agilis]|uniref:Probable branched-chain-amino-acid aminotransferase n=1 Tax=Xanthobacter agilis TaxID=47492 RepID=A0ABU0LAX3_XANAG|nr:D-amino-acid transaminase [Xanthobacter agilis]MDQ0504292.1 D-alanine transaminase [Xanthobacter agilis]